MKTYVIHMGGQTSGLGGSVRPEYAVYNKKAPKSQLHTIPTSSGIDLYVTDKEMVKVYTNSIATLKQPGRLVYNRLLSVPKNNKCPYCGHREVTSIDHYLPKSKYAIYSVIPINLVPCCHECNKIKDVVFPLTSEEEILHPYYDDVEKGTWLKAEIKDDLKVVEFYTSPPKSWGDVLSKRIANHFSVLNLSSLFSIQSANELSNINYHLQTLHSRGGKEIVSKHLESMAKSCSKHYLNSWETALYSCLHKSDWFCDGGFSEMFD